MRAHFTHHSKQSGTYFTIVLWGAPLIIKSLSSLLISSSITKSSLVRYYVFQSRLQTDMLLRFYSVVEINNNRLLNVVASKSLGMVIIHCFKPSLQPYLSKVILPPLWRSRKVLEVIFLRWRRSRNSQVFSRLDGASIDLRVLLKHARILSVSTTI